MAMDARRDEADFAVVGGGLVGTAVAWGLARLGRRVLVLDDAASDERMDPRRRDYTAFTRARSTLTVLALATPSRLLAEWDR